MTRLAPASSTCCARSIVGMPPPACTGSRFAICSTSAELSPLPHRRVEVDQLHKGKAREALDPIFEVVESEAQFFALHELDDAPAQKIN